MRTSFIHIAQKYYNDIQLDEYDGLLIYDALIEGPLDVDEKPLLLEIFPDQHSHSSEHSPEHSSPHYYPFNHMSYRVIIDLVLYDRKCDADVSSSTWSVTPYIFKLAMLAEYELPVIAPTISNLSTMKMVYTDAVHGIGFNIHKFISESRECLYGVFNDVELLIWLTNKYSTSEFIVAGINDIKNSKPATAIANEMIRRLLIVIGGSAERSAGVSAERSAGVSAERSAGVSAERSAERSAGGSAYARLLVDIDDDRIVDYLVNLRRPPYAQIVWQWRSKLIERTCPRIASPSFDECVELVKRICRENRVDDLIHLLVITPGTEQLEAAIATVFDGDFYFYAELAEAMIVKNYRPELVVSAPYELVHHVLNLHTIRNCAFIDLISANGFDGAAYYALYGGADAHIDIEMYRVHKKYFDINILALALDRIEAGYADTLMSYIMSEDAVDAMNDEDGAERYDEIVDRLIDMHSCENVDLRSRLKIFIRLMDMGYQFLMDVNVNEMLRSIFNGRLDVYPWSSYAIDILLSADLEWSDDVMRSFAADIDSLISENPRAANDCVERLCHARTRIPITLSLGTIYTIGSSGMERLFANVDVSVGVGSGVGIGWRKIVRKFGNPQLQSVILNRIAYDDIDPSFIRACTDYALNTDCVELLASCMRLSSNVDPLLTLLHAVRVHANECFDYIRREIDTTIPYEHVIDTAVKFGNIEILRRYGVDGVNGVSLIDMARRYRETITDADVLSVLRLMRVLDVHVLVQGFIELKFYDCLNYIILNENTSLTSSTPSMTSLICSEVDFDFLLPESVGVLTQECMPNCTLSLGSIDRIQSLPRISHRNVSSILGDFIKPDGWQHTLDTYAKNLYRVRLRANMNMNMDIYYHAAASSDISLLKYLFTEISRMAPMRLTVEKMQIVAAVYSHQALEYILGLGVSPPIDNLLIASIGRSIRSFDVIISYDSGGIVIDEETIDLMKRGKSGGFRNYYYLLKIRGYEDVFR